MESKKINQLATELSPDLSDLTIIGDPTTGISKKITLSQMASLFTGTVEEYANLAAFPLVGVADTIYIALDTNILYRWNTGTSAYVELSPNIVSSLVFNDANGFDGTISLVGSVATLTITTALTTGSVGFIGASGALLQDNANFFWDDTNNRLGLGTNAPTTALDVFGSGIIGRLNGTSTNNAYLGFANAGTNKWSVGNVQSDHRFRIFSEANSAELVSVLQTGEFGIGIANPTTKFHIDGAASALIANLDANVSVAKSVSFRSDNSARINLEVSGTESGSNIGADFFLRTFTDAGSLLETPFSIVRSTGVTTIKSLTLTNVLSVANGGTGATSFTSGSILFSNGTLIAQDNSNLFFDDTNNRLGIGTSSPGLNLSAQGLYGLPNTSGTQTVGIFRVQDSASNIALDMGVVQNAATWIQSGNKANSAVLPLILNPSGGNVGIGTASPFAKLSIASPAGITSFPTYSTVDQASTNWWYWASAAEGYTRYMDIAAKGSPDGTYGGSIIRFLTNGITNASNPIERARITETGYSKYSNNGTYSATIPNSHQFSQSLSNSPVILSHAQSNDFVSETFYANIVRAANSAYGFLAAASGNFGDLEFKLYGDGNGKCDGSWTGGGADYAEYFEWFDGNANNEDRRGYSVSLIENKIKIAEKGENIIGVISGNPSIVGDAAWNKWSGKYLRDDFGSYILDENGDRTLSSNYNEDIEYIPRDKRPEWSIVGLMGKLRIRKGQETMPNWVKMKDISDSVEEWLIK